MRRIIKQTLTAILMMLTVPVLALAQKAVTRGEVVEMTAEIMAIDKDARTVTLKDADGVVEEVVCGPE